MDGSTIKLWINGEIYNVDARTISPNSRLVDFIREEAHLTGTKVTCREGGCGACVVSVKWKDAVTGEDVVKGVNSCLVPVLSCNGWNISTIESLGNLQKLHPIQKQMVDFNASQCGFCSSGMIMSMHSLMESNNGQVSSARVEKILDGNICRCTGYRPILDAFKSLSTDPSDEIKERCTDMEDLNVSRCSMLGCSRICGSGCCQSFSKEPSSEIVSTEIWKTPITLKDALDVIRECCKTNRKYRLIAGNTGTGVYKHDGPFDVYINIGCISELKKWTVDSTGISVGGGITLTELIDILNTTKVKKVLPFASRVVAHIERIGNVPVRNRSSLGGNLMLKHVHKDFPSDVFIILETLGTKIRIASATEANPKLFTLLEWLQMDMNGKIILSFSIPHRTCAGYIYRSFKITRRFQNAHAYVNAGFLFKLERNREGVSIVERPRILFGGISSSFTHASGTEQFLSTQKYLNNAEMLPKVFEILDKEVSPTEEPLEASVEYRKLLTKSLLYKVFLEILATENIISDNIKSGGLDIERKMNHGVPRINAGNNNNTNELYGPVKKLEGPAQVTGEAEYLNDIAKFHKELIAVFVLSTIAKGKLVKMDASKALRVPGVVAFVTSKDIPKANNAMPFGMFPISSIEPIFVADDISYAGQALGLILAETREAAFAAATMVKVKYSNIEKPLVGVKQVLAYAKANNILESTIFSTTQSNQYDECCSQETNLTFVEGEFVMGSQAHFHMELQGCICVPIEDGMDIFCGTQWIDHSVATVAGALGISHNTINMKVRRIGGSFGARITKASGIIAACAVAANKVKRPVRLILDFETNMNLVGKRPPCLATYKVGFDKCGQIGKLDVSIWSDMGYAANEPMAVLIVNAIQNVYRATNWEIKVGGVTTNTPSNTFARAPVTTEAVAIIEYIMEHVAHAVGRTAMQVRMVNMARATDIVFPGNEPFNENVAVDLIEELKVAAEYNRRWKTVDIFNQNNRWKKRGLALVPVKFAMELYPMRFPTYVTINHTDGSVAVSHGGIEIGNGINTKVAQAVAHTLSIPLEMVRIKPTDNFISNNGTLTGGSWTNERCSASAVEACKILMGRLDSVKAKMEVKNPNWKEIVHAAYEANQNLSAHYMHSALDGGEGYNVWLANLTEVEIDVLTGEYKICRVDIIEDTGTSMNPAIDLGQIEGGYIMGQGLWTTEQVVYDEHTGKLLTDRTWTYKVPETKDIPEDFRISLSNSTPNPKNIFGSKATGEPSVNSGVCVLFALKNAIHAARKNAGNFEWYNIEGPITPEHILTHALTAACQFTYKSVQ